MRTGLRNFLLSRPPQKFARRQNRAQFEQPAAAWAGVGTRRLDFGDGAIDSEPVADFDQATNTIERDRTVGVHETVVTDFHEACGQHVLQESADEFHDFESKDSWTFAVRLAVANEHHAVLDVDDARVGDRDFEDIGSQVFEASFAGGHRLAVDVPVDLPDFRGDLVEQLGLLYSIAELGPKDFGKRHDGEKEIDSGGMPGAIG